MEREDLVRFDLREVPAPRLSNTLFSLKEETRIQKKSISG